MHVRNAVILSEQMSAEATATLMDPVGGLVVKAPGGNVAAVDGWMYMELEGGRREIWMLQLTVAGGHNIGQLGLGAGVQHARRGSWANAPYRFLFVVPPEVSDKYRSTRQPAPTGTDKPYISPWSGTGVTARPKAAPGHGDHIEQLLDENRFTLRRVRSAANRVDERDGRLPAVVWELALDWDTPRAQPEPEV